MRHGESDDNLSYTFHMEIIFGEVFGRGFFIVGTIVVLSILYYAYYKNIYSVFYARLFLVTSLAYMVSFLWHRYITAHISEEAASEPSYALIASIHGTIALLAIIDTILMVVLMERALARGENYFKMHPKFTVVIATLWPLALLSGLLL